MRTGASRSKFVLIQLYCWRFDRCGVLSLKHLLKKYALPVRRRGPRHDWGLHVNGLLNNRDGLGIILGLLLCFFRELGILLQLGLAVRKVAFFSELAVMPTLEKLAHLRLVAVW